MCNSYDIIGDIAIIRLHGTLVGSERIAEALLNTHKNLRTVLAQIGGVGGDFRLRKLEYVAGERKNVTRHGESACRFSVNVENCYFSPRLSYERMRVARQVGRSEIIVNMFAGVGCFSIVIAKHSMVEKVYSIDVNPEAIKHMQENVRLNRVCQRVVPILGDAKEIIGERLIHTADRVIMPLPEKASEYLPFALLALKKTGGWIHYYDFGYAMKRMDAEGKVKLKASERLQSLGAKFQVVRSRVVRPTGPYWWQIVLDLEIGPEGSEAFPR